MGDPSTRLRLPSGPSQNLRCTLAVTQTRSPLTGGFRTRRLSGSQSVTGITSIRRRGSVSRTVTRNRIALAPDSYDLNSASGEPPTRGPPG